MAVFVILVLVVLWAAVLIPPILRSRSSSGLGGVSDFMDGLRSLGNRHHGPKHDFRRRPALHGPVGGPIGGPPPAGRHSRQPIAPPVAYRPMPGSMSPMQRRRRNVLMVLVGASAVTFLLALVARTVPFFALFVLALAATAGYCYLLVQLKHRAVPTRAAPVKRTYVTPVEVEDEAPKIGDNVIVLRRSVG